MQLFRTESSDTSEKILPRATQFASATGIIYVFFFLCCAVSLWLSGMSWFDAVCHGMTVIATGGFANYDASIAHFNNAQIEYIIVLFMILGSLPFVLYIQMLHGNFKAMMRDSQVQWFLSIITLSIIIATLWLFYNQSHSWEMAFRKALFNIVSIMTTAGFATDDYNQWGSFVLVLMFIIGVLGGCTGSTTGGMKIFRIKVLYETAKLQIMQLITPHAVMRPTFNNKPISEPIIASVMAFIILFCCSFTAVALLLSLTGLDYITAMSAAASAVANIGPGLGEIVGPTGNYAALSDAAKWIMSIAMLFGRLELFTVLVLFTPAFWRS